VLFRSSTTTIYLLNQFAFCDCTCQKRRVAPCTINPSTVDQYSDGGTTLRQKAKLFQHTFKPRNFLGKYCRFFSSSNKLCFFIFHHFHLFCCPLHMLTFLDASNSTALFITIYSHHNMDPLHTAAMAIDNYRCYTSGRLNVQQPSFHVDFPLEFHC